MKLCFITSSRADFGLIKPVIDIAKKRPGIELQIIATGTHLSKNHGHTIDEITKSGLKVTAEVKMLEDDDTAESIVESMGNELIGLSSTLTRLKPDLIVMAGDRYEMLAAATACLILQIPIAHIYGGDLTEGAFDDAIRHAITKMSHLHFAASEDSRRRVIQMGEVPETVFNSGSPSLDKIITMVLLSKEELVKDLKIKFREYNLLATFHPETRSRQSVEDQAKEFTSALAWLDDRHSIIITMPNADPGNDIVKQAIQKTAKNKDNIYLFQSLGYERYFSLMSHVQIVIGNSSSGIYEAPSFKVPTVNIGNRQKGRIMAESVITCACLAGEINKAIEYAKTLDCSSVKNPYGDGDSAVKIIDAILAAKISPIKKFHDIHNS